MAPSFRTVLVQNLPADISRLAVENDLQGVAANKSCIVSVAPVVNVYNGDPPSIASRSTTVTICGSRWEKVVEQLQNRTIWSKKESRQMRVSDSFLGSSILAENQDSKVDVYFLHGLSGHAFNTWACPIAGNNPATVKAWPRDFLPAGFDAARLQGRFVTIGYNANVISKPDGSGSIRTYAENLIAQLLADRPEGSAASQRPMYLVCHSLGGLVACQMLISLLSNKEQYEDRSRQYSTLLRSSTGECLVKGIVFLGTPFQGSIRANQLGKIGRALQKINPLLMNTGIVEELKYVRDGQGDLDTISGDANIIIEEEGIEVLIGCETSPVGGIGHQLVTNRSSAVGSFSSDVPITLDGDHIQMVKFMHPTDNKYHELQSRIVQLVAKTSASSLSRLPLRQATVGASEPTLNTSASMQNPPALGVQRRETEPHISQSNSNRVSVHIHWPPGSRQLPPTLEPEDYDELGNGGSSGLGPSTTRNPQAHHQPHYPFPRSADGKLQSLAGNVAGATDARDGGDFSRLAMFDTVFIVDDTSSMQVAANSMDQSQRPLSRWAVLEKCLQYISEIAIAHDKDGVDIQFLKMTRLNATHITDPSVVLKKLEEVREHLDKPECGGGTEFYNALEEAIEPRLSDYREYVEMKRSKKRVQRPKPLNLIVITDGEAGDTEEVRWYLTEVGVELTEMRAIPRQIGVQFVQIGDDERAAEWLEGMDERLQTEDGRQVRDFIDTRNFRSQEGEPEEALKSTLLHILLAAVTDRLDHDGEAEHAGHQPGSHRQNNSGAHEMQ